MSLATKIYSIAQLDLGALNFESLNKYQILWLHVLLKAYTDVFEFRKELAKLKSEKLIEATRRRYLYDGETAWQGAIQLDAWINSNSMRVGSLRWICQYLSKDDGAGMVEGFRQAVKREEVRPGFMCKLGMQYRK